MALLFVFFDGIGIAPVSQHNPFAHAAMPFIAQHLAAGLTSSSPSIVQHDKVYRCLDACLETTGLPQSATGQSALLTGINAAQQMGRHYGPQPGPTLKSLLDTENIFARLVSHNKRLCLSNFYPQTYRQAIATGRRRPNAITYAAQRAGIKLRDEADYRHARAIAADLTGAHTQSLLSSSEGEGNERYKEEYTKGYIGAFAMGQRLASIARAHDFTFFDGWITDIAGHRWGWSDCLELLQQLDSFLAGIFSQAEDLTVLLTSDHGNLEDKSSKSHTYNPVPLLVWGVGAEYFGDCLSLLDVAPAIYRYFALSPSL